MPVCGSPRRSRADSLVLIRRRNRAFLLMLPFNDVAFIVFTGHKNADQRKATRARGLM